MGSKFRSTGKLTDHMVYEETRILEAGTVARLITANGGVTASLPDCRAVLCVLNISDIQDNALDLLDVYVQTFVGGAWVDVCAFPQIPGNDADSAQLHVGKITADLAQAMIEDIDALAESAIRNFIGTAWRCRWTITDGGGAHSFTFSVKIQPM